MDRRSVVLFFMPMAMHLLLRCTSGALGPTICKDFSRVFSLLEKSIRKHWARLSLSTNIVLWWRPQFGILIPMISGGGRAGKTISCSSVGGVITERERR